MKQKLILVSIILLAVTGIAYGQDTPRLFSGETLPPDLLFRLMDINKGKALFDDTLSNAHMEEGGWAVENGVLSSKGKGDIWTKERYGNFMLGLEFKCEEDTNSGVFIRCGDMKEWLHSSIEVQILQNNQEAKNDKHHCGGIFDCVAPFTQEVKKPGEWNNMVIIAQDNVVYVLLNGKQVIGMNLDKWTEPHKNPDGTPNKFNNAYKDMPREGHIGLQYHGHPIAFRSLFVTPLDKQ